MAGDLSDYYANCPIPKHRARVLVKADAKRDAAKAERECRAAVDRRDKRRCFFPRCRAHAGEKHHIQSSSTRGKRVWRTEDILSACTPHHALFKAGLIRVAGNPDRGPVVVTATALGAAEGIVIPT